MEQEGIILPENLSDQVVNSKVRDCFTLLPKLIDLQLVQLLSFH